MRRTALKNLLVVAVLALSVPGALGAQVKPRQAADSATAAEVWVKPTCGCCGKWVDHLSAAGFTVTKNVTTELDSVAARKRVPASLRSCHTAVIGKYLVEGHVPADVVRKMLEENPAIAGIAVPGMPVGSPGMEGPNPQPYAIVAFRADGSTYEFARR